MKTEVRGVEPGDAVQKIADQLKIPLSGNWNNTLTRFAVWEWLGIPQVLWPMMELMGVSIVRKKPWSLEELKRGQFVVCMPYPSRPQDSLKFDCTDDCETWGEEGWRHVLTLLVDAVRDTR